MLEQLLPSDSSSPRSSSSSSSEQTNAHLIEKRIFKLTRECFDSKIYAQHIEQWHMDNHNNDTDTDNKEEDKKEDDDKENKEQEAVNNDENKEEKEEVTTDENEQQNVVAKIATTEDKAPKTIKKPKKKKKKKKKKRNKSQLIIDEYPDLNQIDDFTKYALIMFHSMLSSLDLDKHIVALSNDNANNQNSEQYKIISTYINTLHDIFASMTTMELRSGLKSKESSSNHRSFGVLSNIKQFVLKCIKTRHHSQQNTHITNQNNKIIWQKLFEILVKISIGDTNVSSLLQSIWYLLPLIDANENKMNFNLKPTMKYIAKMRILNGNKSFIERNRRYALMRESKVFGFGKCTEGRIGCKLKMSEQFVIEPRNLTVLNSKNICKVTAFSQHALALSNDGHVYSWGSGKSVQLGYPPNSTQIQTEPRLIISVIDLKIKVVDISCGMAHSLIISDVGYVYTFGNGTSGRLGHGDQSEKLTPTLIKSLAISNKFIISGSCGSTFNILIDDNGKMHAFGKNNVGQCGMNHTDPHVLTPKLIPFESDKYVIDVAAGWEHALCCTSDGDIFSWGHGYEGTRAVLGLGDKAMRIKPTLIEKLKDENIVRVCCGYDHSVCATVDGKLYTFGLLPALIEMTKYSKKKESKIIDIAAGEAHSLCLDEDGWCYSWLHKANSAVSDVKRINKNHFDGVPVRSVAAGDKFSFFITAKMEKKQQVIKKKSADEGSSEIVLDKHGLSELKSEFVMKLEHLSLADETENDLEAIQIISYMISVIDRSCKSIIPSSEQFWQSDNAKKAKLKSSGDEIRQIEPFTFELSRNTFVLLNDLLTFTMKKIQSHLRMQSEIPIIPKSNTDDPAWDGWLWWFAASILRILKSHFHVLATNLHKKENEVSVDHDVKKTDDKGKKSKMDAIEKEKTLLKLLSGGKVDLKTAVLMKKEAQKEYFVFDADNESDVRLLEDIHNTILNILHGHSFKGIKLKELDNKNRLRILDIRRESGEVLICGLHVFHKNPNDRLTLLKSILIEDNDKNKTLIQDDAILPFGRSLKEGLLQVFAQQIASQKMTAFTSNELHDWLIVLDSVMQTIHSHINKSSQSVLTRKDKNEIAEHEQDAKIEDLKPAEKIKSNFVLCKCGQPMKLLEIKQCYNGSGVNCDFCGESVDKNSKVWHCLKEKDAIEHKGGFDLCTKCIKHPMIDPNLLNSDDEKEDDANNGVDEDAVYNLSFEGEDINENCPPRHPLIAAFQSALSSSILSKKTEHLKAMEEYTNILLKHSENIISDLYDKYMAIEQQILNDDALSANQQRIECQIIRFEVDALIEKSLLGQGGLWWWLHILHVLAIYPFFTEDTFKSCLNILKLLYKMRTKPTKYYIQSDGISFLDRLPFEKICNLLTSLCVHLVFYQWWKSYDVYEKNKEENEENNKIIKLRNGENRIKAMQKVLVLFELDHSIQCYFILLNATRSTASFATILHERHYLEVCCCILINAHDLCTA